VCAISSLTSTFAISFPDEFLYTFIIVTIYIDISRKMNYNRNIQFAGLELAYMNSFNPMRFWSYTVQRPHALVVYRKDLGFESTGGIFFGILNYVCNIFVKRFTFAISHLLMSACVHVPVCYSY